MTLRHIALAATVAALAGCSGNSLAVKPPPAPSAPPSVPILGAALQSASFTFTIGRSAANNNRRPLYVSSATNGAAIYAVAHGAGFAGAIPLTTDVSSGSLACGGQTGFPRSCTAAANAPVGTDDFRVILYDAVPTNATTPAGNALARKDLTSGIVISSGVANAQPAVTLDGVIASVASGATVLSAPKDGTIKSLTLPVSAVDAAGQTIVSPGNYTTALNLAVSNDPNNALALSSNSIASPSANGTTNITVSYDTSKTLTSGTVTLSATGSSNSPAVTVVPLVYSPATLSLTVGAGTGTITASESGKSSAFTASSDATGVATVTASATPASSGAAVPFTVTPVARGTANISISDGNGASAVVAVNVLGPGSMIEYTIPTAGSNPFGMTLGPDGALWFSEYNSKKIGRLTTSGSFSEFSIPVSPRNIVTGSDNNLWFTEGTGNIAKITTAGSFTDYVASGQEYYPIAAGPDGALWTMQGNFGVFGYGHMTTSGVYTTFALTPSYLSTSFASGADGNLWAGFQDLSFYWGYIGKITPAGVSTTYLVSATSNPRGIALGPDGNIWFTDVGDNKIGKITPAGVMTRYALPSANSNPVSMASGPGGKMYFTESGTNRVGSITTSGVISEYNVIPTANSNPSYVTSAPDGNIWVLETTGNKILKLIP